jgi:hypothetical protein
MNVIFLALISVLVGCQAAPSANMDTAKKCYKTLKDGGVSDRFAGVVAHGIHSMSLDQLQKFEPSATENNIIPTVNMDLGSNLPILPNVRDMPATKKSFQTDGMRAVDQVLSHMDNKNYDIKEYSALERLVHALHMREVWFHAQKRYADVKASPPSVDVCKCARDVDNNGILKVLRFIALAIREPALMYGKHTTLDNGGIADWPGNLYTFTDPNNLQLQSPEKAIPSLKDEASWQEWKKLMLHDENNFEGIKFNSVEEANDDYYLALYVYCALQL